MRATVALAAVLVAGACTPSNDAGIRAEEPASAPAPTPSQAAKPAPLDPAFAGDLMARGTEPFWAVQVGPKTLTLKRPSLPDVSARHAGPRMEGDAAVWGDDAFRLTVRKGECSDGMSDHIYPLTSEARVGGETFKGCAGEAINRGQVPPP